MQHLFCIPSKAKILDPTGPLARSAPLSRDAPKIAKQYGVLSQKTKSVKPIHEIDAQNNSGRISSVEQRAWHLTYILYVAMKWPDPHRSQKHPQSFIIVLSQTVRSMRPIHGVDAEENSPKEAVPWNLAHSIDQILQFWLLRHFLRVAQNSSSLL